MSYQPYDYSAYQYQAAVGYPQAPDYSTYYGHPAQAPEPPPQQPSQPPPPALQMQTINNSVASQSMRRILSSELRNAGFRGYQSIVMERLENEVVSFVELLYRHAKEYAALANRVTPTPQDLLAACEERDMTATQLRKASKKKRRKRAAISPTRLVSPPPREPSPEILPSDDDDAPVSVQTPVALPQTLQDLPDHLPSLPPKHTYLRTAPAAPKRSKLPSLDKKLDNAAKVQQSLRSLVKATEDTAGKGDLELSGGVVNWVATANTSRKRWKVR